MTVKITVSKIQRLKQAKTETYSTAVDMYVEGENLEIRQEGAVAVVFDKKTKTIYTTDLAYATAVTTLDAAATAGLQWVLT